MQQRASRCRESICESQHILIPAFYVGQCLWSGQRNDEDVMAVWMTPAVLERTYVVSILFYGPCRLCKCGHVVRRPLLPIPPDDNRQQAACGRRQAA